MTSSTVHCVSSTNVSRPAIMVCVSLTRTASKSGTPSPVTADVGTTDTYLRGSGFSSYSATLSPCSLRASVAAASRFSNSDTTCGACAASAARNPASGVGFQSNRRSTLLSATMNGVLRILSRLMDSMVCGSRPCMRSTTRTAMSHRPDPRDRRLENDSWPGVSMTSKPGSASPGMVSAGSPGRRGAVRLASASAGM